MIDRPQRPHIHFRWVDSAEKRRWMRALAMLLQVMEGQRDPQDRPRARGVQARAGAGSLGSSSRSA